MDEKQRAGANALAAGQLIKTSQYKGAGDPIVVEQRQSALQRIQVGLIGLVVVLLFVSLANMVLDRVTDAPPVSETRELSESGNVNLAPNEAPAEPLAELGVTPVAPDEVSADSNGSAPVSQNGRRAPANQQR